jgi:hypothetical protein
MLLLQKNNTPTPGIEPGFPARQAGVLTIGQHGHNKKYLFLFLKLAIQELI